MEDDKILKTDAAEDPQAETMQAETDPEAQADVREPAQDPDEHTRLDRKSPGRPYLPWRAKLFRMVSVGVVGEPVNQFYDILSTGAVIANLAVGILSTFDDINAVYGNFFTAVEIVTILFFAVDYVLRLITAPELYPEKKESMARLAYMVSPAGIIDLLSFLPYGLPMFFPAGMAAFRLFRVARIFRLFRINAYYDSLNVITEVLYRKRQQLLSSVFIIATLMVASSLCMYSLEHDAQPDVFRNAFSGIWWSVSTMLTVGYGDIYPITPLGKALSIIITFLGVGVVAIPTGIISAGFVEQYSILKHKGEYALEEKLRMIKVRLIAGDRWCGKTIRGIALPKKSMAVAILRGNRHIEPNPEVILYPGDIVVIGAEASANEPVEELREVRIGEGHAWNNEAIKDLDISRQSYIAVVQRGDRILTPRQDLILRKGDEVFIFDKRGRKRPQIMDEDE